MRYRWKHLIKTFFIILFLFLLYENHIYLKELNNLLEKRAIGTEIPNDHLSDEQRDFGKNLIFFL